VFAPVGKQWATDVQPPGVRIQIEPVPDGCVAIEPMWDFVSPDEQPDPHPNELQGALLP
jgi:hypothetical protein